MKHSLPYLFIMNMRTMIQIQPLMLIFFLNTLIMTSTLQASNRAYDWIMENKTAFANLTVKEQQRARTYYAQVQAGIATKQYPDSEIDRIINQLSTLISTPQDYAALTALQEKNIRSDGAKEAAKKSRETIEGLKKNPLIVDQPAQEDPPLKMGLSQSQKILKSRPVSPSLIQGTQITGPGTGSVIDLPKREEKINRLLGNKVPSGPSSSNYKKIWKNTLRKLPLEELTDEQIDEVRNASVRGTSDALTANQLAMLAVQELALMGFHYNSSDTD